MWTQYFKAILMIVIVSDCVSESVQLTKKDQQDMSSSYFCALFFCLGLNAPLNWTVLCGLWAAGRSLRSWSGSRSCGRSGPCRGASWTRAASEWCRPMPTRCSAFAPSCARRGCMRSAWRGCSTCRVRTARSLYKHQCQSCDVASWLLCQPHVGSAPSETALGFFFLLTFTLRNAALAVTTLAVLGVASFFLLILNTRRVHTEWAMLRHRYLLAPAR